jgi:hypothetical protein
VRLGTDQNTQSDSNWPVLSGRSQVQLASVRTDGKPLRRFGLWLVRSG